MDTLKIRFDPSANTLQVFFSDPAHMAYLSPIEGQTPGDLHLIKDETGTVIGFEAQFYQYEAGALSLAWELLPLLRPAAVSPKPTPE